MGVKMISEERLNRFNVDGIKRDTRVYISTVNDVYDYELTVRAINILNKQQMPEGVTTINDLAKLKWMTPHVLREYVEEGIIKKVSPKGRSIRDVHKIRTLVRRLFDKFRKCYFGREV